MTQPLWTQPVESLAPKLKAGTLSPVALTQACLDRIAQVDGRLQSFIHISSTALDQARAAEREIKAGNWRGPLHGIPVGVKDNYLTRDMPTTAGTVAPDISFPLRDSAAAARLRQAGAVLIGKTRTHARPQSVGLVARAVGIERRLGCSAGCRSVHSGARFGYRRLDPHARQRDQHRRAEANLRPRQP